MSVGRRLVVHNTRDIRRDPLMIRLAVAGLACLLACARLSAQAAPAAVLTSAEVQTALAAAAAASPDMMVARMRNTHSPISKSDST